MNFNSHFAQLARELTVVGERSRAALASAPSTASDPTGIVTVTMPMGQLPIVRVATLWNTVVAPHSLADAIMTTAQSIDRSRATAWAEAVNSGQVFGPVAPLRGQPTVPLTPIPYDSDRQIRREQRRDSQIESEERIARAEQAPAVFEGSDRGNLATVAVNAQYQFTEVRLEAAAIVSLPGDVISEALNEATLAAGERMDAATRSSESRDPLQSIVAMITGALRAEA